MEHTVSVMQLAVGGYDANLSYLLVSSSNRNALLVDPSGDIDLVFRELQRQSLTLVGIVITHTHFDHIERLRDVLASYTVPVYVHTLGAKRVDTPAELVRCIAEGDTVPLDEVNIHVLHTPGHSDDSICLYIDAHQSVDGIPKLISGDTLFVEGCGRTTFEHVNALYESLQRLKALPEATEVYPGHEYGSRPYSDLAYEKKHNRFLQAQDLDTFVAARLPA